MSDMIDIMKAMKNFDKTLRWFFIIAIITAMLITMFAVTTAVNLRQPVIELYQTHIGK